MSRKFVQNCIYSVDRYNRNRHNHFAIRLNWMGIQDDCRDALSRDFAGVMEGCPSG